MTCERVCGPPYRTSFAALNDQNRLYMGYQPSFLYAFPIQDVFYIHLHIQNWLVTWLIIMMFFNEKSERFKHFVGLCKKKKNLQSFHVGARAISNNLGDPGRWNGHRRRMDRAAPCRRRRQGQVRRPAAILLLLPFAPFSRWALVQPFYLSLWLLGAQCSLPWWQGNGNGICSFPMMHTNHASCINPKNATDRFRCWCWRAMSPGQTRRVPSTMMYVVHFPVTG